MNTSVKSDKIMNALLEIGIPANLRGFLYLVYAEQLILENEAYMIGITKALYLDIAKAFGTSPCGVERCIRTAIEHGWHLTPPEVKTKFFGNSIEKQYPTNAQFIIMLHYYINLQ